MTLPKGFGGSRYSDSVKSRQDRYPARIQPKRLRRMKTNYCLECGHLKRNHDGFLVKGRCKICMCPKFKSEIVEVG